MAKPGVNRMAAVKQVVWTFSVHRSVLSYVEDSSSIHIWLEYHHCTFPGVQAPVHERLQARGDWWRLFQPQCEDNWGEEEKRWEEKSLGVKEVQSLPWTVRYATLQHLLWCSWKMIASITCDWIKNKPKAQRTWGLNSVYQSSFLWSYQKFLLKSW